VRKKPLISVITVVYNLINANREEYFRQCIESVHNQSYENIEHIIIDGASTDGTIEIIKEYEQKNWVKYISEPDSGLYDAMNKGVKLAQGEYLAFLNSDDFYSDNKGIEKCIKKLQQTNADFSYTKAKIIDENNKSVKNHLHKKTNFGDVFVEMPFSHQTMIVKTDVFKKLGMYNLDYKSASDYEFVLKMVFNNCSYTKLSFNLVTFRYGGFSTENALSSYDEIANFYLKYYNQYLDLSKDEAREIYLKKLLPLPLIKPLCKYLSPTEQINLLKSQFLSKKGFKRIRKSIFQLKLSKNEKYFKLFGFKIF